MDCIKNIGCYPSCNAIKFPYPALETGVHFVVFDWLGTKKTIAFEAVEGETFYIPNYFNESSDPVFSIKQPSGDYLCWDKELEALAVCPDNCGKDCDFYRHFTLEINQTSDFPGQGNEDPDLAYSDKVYNIDEAHDNGDGTYTINVMGAANGDLAVDDNGTFYEYQDGVWTIKFQDVCSVQSYPTFEDLPVDGKECVLYIADGKYYMYSEVYCDYQDPANVFQPFFNSFEELPNPGDPTFTYVVDLGGDNLELYVWVDGAYQPVYFDGAGGYPTEWAEGQYVFVALGKIVVGCTQYQDVSPDSTNLFTDDLTLTDPRTHTVDDSFTMNLRSGGGRSGRFSVVDLEVTSAEKATLQFGNGTIIFQTITQTNIQAGFLVLGSTTYLFTGQVLSTAYSTGQRFLKLQTTTGRVEYSKILSDDIDDSTSTKKFVTQAEKDQIGKPIPEYASDTAADNDSNLPSGAMYAVTGDRTVKRKP